MVCTGGAQSWELRLQTEGRASVDKGAAVVVALARTFDRRVTVTGAHQWLVEVTLGQQL